MVLRGRQFLHLVEKVIGSYLAEERQAPIVLDALEIQQRLLFLAHVVLGAVELLQEVLVRQVADLGGQLPAIGQVLAVLEPHPPAQVLRHVHILACPAQTVFAVVVDDVAQKRAEVVFSLVIDFDAAARAAFAVVIQRKRTVRALRLAQTKKPIQIPPRLERGPKGAIVPGVDAPNRKVRPLPIGVDFRQGQKRHIAIAEPDVPQLHVEGAVRNNPAQLHLLGVVGDADSCGFHRNLRLPELARGHHNLVAFEFVRAHLPELFGPDVNGHVPRRIERLEHNVVGHRPLVLQVVVHVLGANRPLSLPEHDVARDVEVGDPLLLCGGQIHPTRLGAGRLAPEYETIRLDLHQLRRPHFLVGGLLPPDIEPADEGDDLLPILQHRPLELRRHLREWGNIDRIADGGLVRLGRAGLGRGRPGRRLGRRRQIQAGLGESG